MGYTYIIIDSNANSNLQLQLFLEEYGDFTCADLSKSSIEGLNAILKFMPDIAFINLDGDVNKYFHMVSEIHQFTDKIPLLIGMSKSKDHAYNAIKNGFFDYWLLPNNEYEIRKSLLRLKKQLPGDTPPQTICLKSYKDFHYLDTDEILYLKADNNATDFVMKDGSTISAFKTLKSFEDKLPENFIRVHQSYIINTQYVSRINYGKSICSLKAAGNMQLPFSKSYKENIDDLKNIMAKNAISTLN
ncbi:LytR/AlgR family response regulator transcription factor [Spongiimicrobium salis]|uniref:LytR/AlgR family response regulator transcription factor n=1 Tax=Spongiimicrobium salis TaxID=1667022 RepID=UPI00374DE6BC